MCGSIGGLGGPLENHKFNRYAVRYTTFMYQEGYFDSHIHFGGVQKFEFHYLFIFISRGVKIDIFVVR